MPVNEISMQGSMMVREQQEGGVWPGWRAPVWTEHVGGTGVSSRFCGRKRDGTHAPGQGQVPGMAAKCRLASCRKEFQSEP